MFRFLHFNQFNLKIIVYLRIVVESQMTMTEHKQQKININNEVKYDFSIYSK